MAKSKIKYSCTACGAEASKWIGQCPECEAWNTLVEMVVQGTVAREGRFAGYTGSAGTTQVQSLAQVSPDDVARTPTGIGEFDRVLGGGMVSGSVVLIGGDPGI
ncbi:MAG: DNA repair protein RadA, partial [Gammaproteobacteria bacterium]|nr:DNA repair protein RadA [Gammaproteobacteria bacterium]